jgi:hypothetical protein
MAAFAWPSTIGAQSLPATAGSEQSANELGGRTYSCADPSDALARLKIQAEPCRWPMYDLPATAGAASSGEPPRLPKYTRSTGSEGDHPMFWRFPVQPRGPFDAPRHTWH